MEFTFYQIVAIVATIFLIILLTIVGLSLRDAKTVNFPPSKNSCPDYWIADYSDPAKVKCKINALNMGTIKKDPSNGEYMMSANIRDKGKIYTPGYNAADKTVDFTDPSWPAAFSSSAQCATKKWANKYDISWDGVSNFASCK